MGIFHSLSSTNPPARGREFAISEAEQTVDIIECTVLGIGEEVEGEVSDVVATVVHYAEAGKQKHNNRTGRG